MSRLQRIFQSSYKIPKVWRNIVTLYINHTNGDILNGRAWLDSVNNNSIDGQIMNFFMNDYGSKFFEISLIYFYYKLLCSSFYIVQFMVIHITSTTDPTLQDVHYILIKEGETIRITRKLASNSGTKALTYKDTYQPIWTDLAAAAHILVYEWVDSVTSNKGLILIRFRYNATDFSVRSASSLDIHVNGFMRMIYDYDAHLSVIYEDDDGTLSVVQLHFASLSPFNYVKLKMPVYQEA